MILLATSDTQNRPAQGIIVTMARSDPHAITVPRAGTVVGEWILAMKWRTQRGAGPQDWPVLEGRS